MVVEMFFSCLATAHLDRSLKIARDEIETYTESTISKQKDIANEVLLLQYNLSVTVQYIHVHS